MIKREFRYIELAGKLRTEILSGYLKRVSSCFPRKSSVRYTILAGIRCGRRLSC
ncbi:hypothetical protein [Cohnella faecalis]|uniref:hypothetical protein n=1 Tax=Cohnella faecalis TaxID=2315694 RepID=UPI001F3ABD67|nr:hypothetical protein [Cohnella faecalis]